MSKTPGEMGQQTVSKLPRGHKLELQLGAFEETNEEPNA